MGDNMPGSIIIPDRHDIVSPGGEGITEIEEEDNRSPEGELLLQVVHTAVVVGSIKTTPLCVEEHINGERPFQVGQVGLIGDVLPVYGEPVVAQYCGEGSRTALVLLLGKEGNALDRGAVLCLDGSPRPLRGEGGAADKEKSESEKGGGKVEQEGEVMA